MLTCDKNRTKTKLKFKKYLFRTSLVNIIAFIFVTVCVSSYSYDLTHTLQFNMLACRLPTVTPSASANQLSSKCQFWQTDVDDDRVVHDSSCSERDVEDASCGLQTDLFADDSTAATGGDTEAVDDTDHINAKDSGLQDSSASTGSKALSNKAS